MPIIFFAFRSLSLYCNQNNPGAMDTMKYSVCWNISAAKWKYDPLIPSTTKGMKHNSTHTLVSGIQKVKRNDLTPTNEQ